MPIPLLFIPLVAYNLMAFGFGGGGMGWDAPLLSLPLPSSEMFRFTLGDGLVLTALALLLTSLRVRPVSKSAFARGAMLAVPLAYACEFLLVPAAATSLFFTCLAMSVAEFLMESRGARTERRRRRVARRQAADPCPLNSFSIRRFPLSGQWPVSRN